jgi:hypothetical protein
VTRSSSRLSIDPTRCPKFSSNSLRCSRDCSSAAALLADFFGDAAGTGAFFVGGRLGCDLFLRPAAFAFTAPVRLSLMSCLRPFLIRYALSLSQFVRFYFSFWIRGWTPCSRRLSELGRWTLASTPAFSSSSPRSVVIVSRNNRNSSLAACL